MIVTRMTYADEAAVGPHDRKFVQAWNSALAACERKAGDGVAWKAGAREWGELVSVSCGGHLAYGESPRDAMGAFLSM